MSCIVAPSILSADFLHLEKDIEMINQSAAEWIHVDVMDGVFVPNISFGFPILEAIRPITQKFLDLHLMIQHPENYIAQFQKAGANGISIHVENNIHIHRQIQQIKDLGMRAGVVLNPSTPIETLSEIIHMLDHVLVMSVNPGFGGQQFIPGSIDKVNRLSKWIKQKELNTLIQVDGGVNVQNAAALVQAGAQILVAGNAVFKSQNPLQTIQDIASAA